MLGDSDWGLSEVGAPICSAPVPQSRRSLGPRQLPPLPQALFLLSSLQICVRRPLGLQSEAITQAEGGACISGRRLAAGRASSRRQRWDRHSVCHTRDEDGTTRGPHGVPASASPAARNVLRLRTAAGAAGGWRGAAVTWRAGQLPRPSMAAPPRPAPFPAGRSEPPRAAQAGWPGVSVREGRASGRSGRAPGGDSGWERALRGSGYKMAAGYALPRTCLSSPGREARGGGVCSLLGEGSGGPLVSSHGSPERGRRVGLAGVWAWPAR